MQRDRLLQLYDLPSGTAGIERTEKKGAGGLFPCLLRLFPECLEEEGITCSIHQGCQIGREVAARLLKMIERKECKGQSYSCIMPPKIYIGNSIRQIEKKQR